MADLFLTSFDARSQVRVVQGYSAKVCAIDGTAVTNFNTVTGNRAYIQYFWGVGYPHSTLTLYILYFWGVGIPTLHTLLLGCPLSPGKKQNKKQKNIQKIKKQVENAILISSFLGMVKSLLSIINFRIHLESTSSFISY